MFVILFTGLAFTAYGFDGNVHQFPNDQCQTCHNDVNGDPSQLLPVTSNECQTCHTEIGRELSHPVDFYPERILPEDLPLVERRLSCITCHYVHPSSSPAAGNYLLRRPGTGVPFCSVCHGISANNNHTVFETAHLSSYRETELASTVDLLSLQCVECHDRYLDPRDKQGIERWMGGVGGRTTHPVGISLDKATGRKPNGFHSKSSLPPAVRLFNGKVGCGSCHNIYSKERNMLSQSNLGSSLCLECHNK